MTHVNDAPSSNHPPGFPPELENATDRELLEIMVAQTNWLTEQVRNLMNVAATMPFGGALIRKGMQR